MSESNESYSPRLLVRITQEQREKLDEFIPWGLKRRIFSNMIDSFISACEIDADKAVAAFITNQIEIAPKRE